MRSCISSKSRDIVKTCFSSELFQLRFAVSASFFGSVRLFFGTAIGGGKLEQSVKSCCLCHEGIRSGVIKALILSFRKVLSEWSASHSHRITSGKEQSVIIVNASVRVGS